MGDTLAGFVGSLTLIWVVASVFQQSMELRAQRSEFSKTSAALESQSKSAILQIEMMQRAREEERMLAADKAVSSALSQIEEAVRGVGSEKGLVEWLFNTSDDRKMLVDHSLEYLGQYRDTRSQSVFFIRMLLIFGQRSGVFWGLEKRPNITQVDLQVLKIIEACLEDIAVEIVHCSFAMQRWRERLHLFALREELRNIRTSYGYGDVKSFW